MKTWSEFWGYKSLYTPPRVYAPALNKSGSLAQHWASKCDVAITYCTGSNNPIQFTTKFCSALKTK